jgi:hypothetical protein
MLMAVSSRNLAIDHIKKAATSTISELNTGLYGDSLLAFFKPRL